MLPVVNAWAWSLPRPPEVPSGCPRLLTRTCVDWAEACSAGEANSAAASTSTSTSPSRTAPMPGLRRAGALMTAPRKSWGGGRYQMR